MRARWHSLNAVDRRSLVLWGVPGSSDMGMLAAEFARKGVCGKYRWRGMGASRHGLAEFKSTLQKNA